MSDDYGLGQLRELAPQVEKWYPNAVKLARMAVQWAPPDRKGEAIDAALAELTRLKERLDEQRDFGNELVALGEKITARAL